MASTHELEPDKTQTTERQGCLQDSSASSEHGKLNIKRGGRKRISRENVNAEVNELHVGKIEVDPEVMTSIDTTSLQMEQNLNKRKITAVTNLEEATQQLDACITDIGVDQLSKITGSCTVSVNNELLKSIEDVHCIERNDEDVLSVCAEVTPSWDSAKVHVDMDTTDEVMFAVDSCNYGSQGIREGLELNQENNRVKDTAIPEELVQSIDIAELKIIEQKQSEKAAGSPSTSIDSEIGTENANSDKPNCVPGNTGVTVDCLASSEVVTKRKRGRPIKSNKQKVGPVILQEELLKLLPDEGSLKFSDEAHSRLKEIFRHLARPIECPREGCTRSFSPLISFKYHVLRCGITLSFSCSECGKVYTSDQGLKYHLEHVHHPQELGKMKVDSEFAARIVSTSLQMEQNLNKGKMKAVTNRGETTQHLDESLESIEDIHCIERNVEDVLSACAKVTPSGDSAEVHVDMDTTDVVMFAVDSCNDGSQEIREGLELNQENNKVKDTVKPNEVARSIDITELKIIEQRQSSEIGTENANPDKLNCVPGITGFTVDCLASSEVVAKRQRGRSRKSNKQNVADQQNVVDPVELLKLLPDKGMLKFSDEAHTKLRKIFCNLTNPIECPREGCTRSYSALISFKYHVLRCGITLSFSCSECGKVYTSDKGLKYHLEHVHRPQIVKRPVKSMDVDSKELHEDEITAGKVVEISRYGRRCRNRSDRSDEKDDDYTAKPKETVEWMEFIETFVEPDPVETSGEAWEQLMKEILQKLDERKSVCCPKKCGHTLKQKTKLKKHLTVCPGTDRQKYRCRLCQAKTFLSLKGIKDHVRVNHLNLKESDDRGDDDSEYEEDKMPQREITRIAKTFYYKEKTKAWCKAIHSKLVYPSWTPTLEHWRKLPLSEVQEYLPVRKMSPRFTVQPATESETTQDYPEIQLPIFSSVPLNNDGDLSCNLTFNVGGSVWAMDWAPVPVDEKNRDQHLAIGCHSDPEQLHLIDELYQEKGVLQIWCVAKLRNGKRPQRNAEFCFGVAYDYGPLWDIRWCPSGAWENVAKKSGHLRRLGLLALACADGKLRILSVPFPESLFDEKTSETNTANPETLIFRATPHAELSPGSAYKEYRGECGAVWSVAWLPAEGHKKILAAYSDGTVALWDLTSENVLLRVVAKDSLEKFFPISHFQAHFSAIRGLTWCPSDSNYIATASYDRFTKIWDIRHTSQPITTLKRGYNYKLVWPLHWASLIYTCDTAMNRGMFPGSRVMYYMQYDEKLEHQTSSLTVHNSAAWDADYSNWSNTLVSVGASGDVQMNILGNLHVCRKQKKHVVPIFRATSEEILHTGNTDPGAINGEKSDSGGKLSGCEKRDSYKLLFKDALPMFADKEEQARLKKDIQPMLVDEIAYAAFHKVLWNPNITSYHWLATGGRAGIVRICHVDVLD